MKLAHGTITIPGKLLEVVNIYVDKACLCIEHKDIVYYEEGDYSTVSFSGRIEHGKD